MHRAGEGQAPLVAGSKLPAGHENPVDALIILAIDRAVDLLHAVGVTPNAVTVMSALTSLLSLVYLVRRRPLPAAALWLASYVLDCTDGLLARRYGLETAFGDRLDHLTDTLAFLGLAAVVGLHVCRNRALPRWPLAVEALLLGLSYVQMSCQQRGSIARRYITIAGIAGDACPSDTFVRTSRWAGMGTLLVWHLVLIGVYGRA